MGRINGCLKCVFNIINIAFVVLACLLIHMISVNKQSIMLEFTGLMLSCIIVVTILAISCLGIYGSCTERECALKMFAGFMIVPSVFMLGWGTYFAIRRHNVKNTFTNEEPEAFKSYMEDDEYRTILENTQASARCCGLSGAEDWGSEIPESCSCTESSVGYVLEECEPRPQNTTGPDQVYAKTCRNDLFSVIDRSLEESMRYVFILAGVPLFQLVMSYLMIKQVKPFEPNMNRLTSRPT